MRVAICEDSKLQYEVLKKQVLKWADEREETIDIEGLKVERNFYLNGQKIVILI